MKVVTGQQMGEIDKKTSQDYHIPSLILMENAGIRITEEILRLYPEIIAPKNRTAIFVGPGNNGGDGLVIARQLNQKQAQLTVFIFGAEEKYKGDAKTNLDAVSGLSIPHKFIQSEEDLNQVIKELSGYTFIIDSIFGTGLKGEPRGLMGQAIQAINKEYNGTVIAVDIPSGLLSSLDGESQLILQCHTTITVGLPKIRMIDYPGKRYTGNLRIVDIGFPKELLEDSSIPYELVTKSTASNLIPPRPPNAHKGNFGHMLILGGSRNLGGAACMVGQSAIRSGVGLVSAASVQSVIDLIKVHSPEVMSISMPETQVGNLSEQGWSVLHPQLERFNTIVIGPGMGREQSTFRLIKKVLKEFTGKVLIDADGLNLLLEDLSMLQETDSQILLTPHIGEMARLANRTAAEIIEKKMTISMDFAKKYNLLLILKSSVTLITTPEGRIYFNSTGNSGMATGGSGDVLSGLIGGLLSQGLNPVEAGVLGVYMHGYAGDLACEQYGAHSMIPTDIIRCFPKAFLDIAGGC